MEKSFDSKEYIRLLGEELVYEFDKAGMTTHPHSVGGGRENSARNKLKAVLPAGVGIGSGFVIDSYGNTSKQCDIILYEENFATKFVINDDLGNAYYNCECVIAVGEVKSDANRADIEDSIKKLATIKKLKRYNDNGYLTRKYLTSQVVTDTLGDEKIPYDNSRNQLAQIYTFLICKQLCVSTKIVLEIMKEHCKEAYEYPNRIVSTDGSLIGFLDATNPRHLRIRAGRIDATKLYSMKDNKGVFAHFLDDLLQFITNATSVPLNYRRYLCDPLEYEEISEQIDL